MNAISLEALVREIRSLPQDQRKQIVIAILDSLTDDQTEKTHDISEFRGAAAHMRDMDAQEYVNKLRS